MKHHTYPHTPHSTRVLERITTGLKLMVLVVVTALVTGIMAQTTTTAGSAAGTSATHSTAFSDLSGVEANQLDVTLSKEVDYRLVGFDPWRGLQYSAQKTARFAGCIFGVGVPIGLVWGIATNPGVWHWVLGRGPLPASVGGTAYRYMSTVKRWCVYALR